MAKSARASVTKRNHAKLRATVFGPASDARTERLSAKLQELAAQSRPEREQQKSSMEVDVAGIEEQRSDSNEDMDIDRGATKTSTKHSQKSGRIQKRNRKKSRTSIVFRQHPSKAKRVSKRK